MATGMYTTKRLNSQKADEGYCSVGNKYGIKAPSPSRALGTQFKIAKLKNNQGNFGAKTYAAHPYDTGTSYLKRQPFEKRKTGFGSHDAQRRDEFSNLANQEQYREKIKAEMKFNDGVLKQAITNGLVREEDPYQPSEEEIKAMKQKWFQSNVPTSLYDIGNTTEGTTPLCNKCSRETYFCKHRVQKDLNKSPERRLGGDEVSSTSYGSFMRSPKNLSPQGEFGSLSGSPTQLRVLSPGPINSQAYLSPASPFGRKHTMHEFKDGCHLEVQARS